MKKLLFIIPLLISAFPLNAANGVDRPLREKGKEPGMMLDLQKISLGTISSVEEKKQYLSTVQLEKQRIQNYTLRMVYENAYTLYKRGDYQRAHELANVILSIDPTLTKAQTLSKEAGRMATYGTLSEEEIVNMKYEEGISLYKHGRLVEAQSKFEEILVLRPNESKAQDWIKRIENEIAEEHTRRGYYAYKNGDYNEALNQWYSVLILKKDDPGLTAKIAEVENTMKNEENQKVLNKAFGLYSQGKLIPAYREFERAMEIQPGEQQTQKFTMQLKDEIAKGYYDAGNKAYNNRKYNTAVANWKEAKNWGYNPNDIAMRIKSAETAKNRAAQAKNVQNKPAPQQKTTPSVSATTPVSSPAPVVVEPEETLVPIPPVDTKPLVGDDTPATPINQPASATPAPVEDPAFPTKVLTNDNPISEDARQASNARYLVGAKYYAEGDYDKAKEAFLAALSLNPENSDAALGLKNIEAKTSAR